MSAKIISAFPGCGKTTYYKKWSQYSKENVWRRWNNGEQVFTQYDPTTPVGDKILDSDSSLFSWIYDENGNRTDKRNPEFPNNYIQYIKDHMETEDVIFVSSHKSVRDALKEAGILYYLIYPSRELKWEWISRFGKRGSSDSFIIFQIQHWDEFINQMEEETYPTKIVLDGYGNRSAITATVMNEIMNYCEISEIEE